MDRQLASWDSNNDGFLDRTEIETGLTRLGATAEDAARTADRTLDGANRIAVRDASTEKYKSLQKNIATLSDMKAKLDRVERTQNQRRQQRQTSSSSSSSSPPPSSSLTSLPAAPNALKTTSGRKKKKKGPVLDKRMIALLARLVDERMNVEFSQRDRILVEMRDSMEVMRGELEQNMMMAHQTAQALTNSPQRPPGGPKFARGSPLTTSRLVQPGVTQSSMVTSLNRSGALGGSGRNEYRLKGTYVPRDEKGRVLLSAKNMPRVSMLVPDDEETRKALRKQAAAADAEYRRSIVRYKQCRSTVFSPSGFIPPSEPGQEQLPSTSLDLEFVHGYSGKLPYRTTPCTNIFPLASGELVYPCSATVVIYDKVMHRQRFFFGHDDDVTCLAVHPNGTVVASGQVGRRPPICVWDATKMQQDDNQGGGGGGTGSGPNGVGGMSAGVTHLGNLLFHSRGVACMDFSTDGSLLVSVGSDDAHHMCVWDWQNGVLLAQARGYNTDIFQVAFSPVNYQGIGGVDDLDDVTYTLITAGRRHIKFWSLYREEPDARTKTEREKDSKDMAARDKRIMLRKKGALTGSNQKEWKLEGNTGSFGRAGKLQDIKCFCFMPGGQVVSGTQSGHLYVWEQPRDMALEVRYTDDGREELPVRWCSKGSLVGIIPNAHDSAVLCISHDPTQPTTYMTAGKDGVLVAWNIGFNEQRKLIHAVVKTIDLPSDQTGGGFPCSLKYLAPFGPADSIAGMCWSVGRLVGWSVGRLVGWSVGRLVGAVVVVAVVWGGCRMFCSGTRTDLICSRFFSSCFT
jgi:WD40 repeat protein